MLGCLAQAPPGAQSSLGAPPGTLGFCSSFFWTSAPPPSGSQVVGPRAALDLAAELGAKARESIVSSSGGTLALGDPPGFTWDPTGTLAWAPTGTLASPWASPPPLDLGPPPDRHTHARTHVGRTHPPVARRGGGPSGPNLPHPVFKSGPTRGLDGAHAPTGGAPEAAFGGSVARASEPCSGRASLHSRRAPALAEVAGTGSAARELARCRSAAAGAGAGAGTGPGAGALTRGAGLVAAGTSAGASGTSCWTMDESLMMGSPGSAPGIPPGPQPCPSPHPVPNPETGPVMWTPGGGPGNPPGPQSCPWVPCCIIGPIGPGPGGGIIGQGPGGIIIIPGGRNRPPSGIIPGPGIIPGAPGCSFRNPGIITPGGTIPGRFISGCQGICIGKAGGGREGPGPLGEPCNMPAGA